MFNDQRNRDAEEKPTTPETEACGSGSRDGSAVNTGVSATTVCPVRVPYPLQYALPELEQTFNGLPLLPTTWRWNREGRPLCDQICIEKRPHMTIRATGEVVYIYVAYWQTDAQAEWRKYLTTAGDFVYFPSQFPRWLQYPCRFFETCCFVSLDVVVAQLQAVLDAELIQKAE